MNFRLITLLAATASAYQPALAAETIATLSVTATVTESCRATTGTASDGSADGDASREAAIVCNSEEVSWTASVEKLPSARSDSPTRETSAETERQPREGGGYVVTITY